MSVRDRALFCYRLLQCGVEEAHRVLGGPKSDPSLGVIAGRPEEPINSWAGDFNTLAPVYSREDWAALTATTGGSPSLIPLVTGGAAQAGRAAAVRIGSFIYLFNTFTLSIYMLTLLGFFLTFLVYVNVIFIIQFPTCRGRYSLI